MQKLQRLVLVLLAVVGVAYAQIKWTAGAPFHGGVALAAYTAGTGITLTAGEFAVDETVIPRYHAGSGSLTFTSIAANTSQTQTFTLTGAAVNDHLAVAIPPALEDGLAPQVWVSAANTISVRLHNYTGSAIDPTNGVTWSVIRIGDLP